MLSDFTNDTGEKGVFTPQSQDKPVTTPPTSFALPAATTPTSGTTAQEHGDNKSALILMGLFIGVINLMMRSEFAIPSALYRCHIQQASNCQYKCPQILR